MEKQTHFLISFMVDARGGAMRGCRHPGVRVIVPPRKCSMPTRVTCRLVKREKLTRPPSMLEGEGLAARILEMGPVGTKFLGPILLEVPHFASLRGKEREVVIMRSDNGTTWYEHPLQATEEAVAEALGSSAEGGKEGSQTSASSLWKLDPEEELNTKRIKRILTTDLPMYFALVSRVTRVKQESTVIGMEGGVLSSNVVPQVQAVLPEGTLTRPIPVGLQAQPIAPELVAKLLGNRVAVSPIVTIEPRRRKFHKPITLTIPVPRAAQKGMINQYGGERPTLRLLFSLAVDPNPAVWEDVTDTKPMTLVDDCVSFTTTVSARFWLIDCQNVNEAAQMASILYQEAVTVPYMAKFVVFAKRDAPEEGKLRVFCMTDDKDDKTLEKQEKFFEVARSRDIEVLEGRPQFVEMAGNLIPVTKSGDQLHVNFRAFRENRLPCTVKIRDQDLEPSARVAFMKEPKVARGEAPQTPICNLNIRLLDMVASDSGELDADKAAEFRQRHEFLRGQGLVIQDSVNRAEMKLSDIADNVQGDWVMLAQQLQVSISDINHIKTNYKTVGDQALAMLHLWVDKNGDKATGNELETALRRINRDDVVRKCMYNVVRVDDEVEAAAARAAMDQSGFDTFKEEVGITKDSMKRGMSLDVQYDEQDVIKESESAAEESPSSDRGGDQPHPRGLAPQALAEDKLDESRNRYDDEEEVQTPPPSPTERFDSEDKTDDEQTQEVTEIVETYRVSEDGKTWKTIKKTTTITSAGTTEKVEVLKEEPVLASESNMAEVASRLESEAADDFNSVFQGNVVSDEPHFREVRDDGTVVSHQRLRSLSGSGDKEVEMELIKEEGPAKEETRVEDHEEVMEDGTVHHTHKVKRLSLKTVKKRYKSLDGEEMVTESQEEVPGTVHEDVLETFNEPARLVQDEENIEQVLDDGTRVQRKLVMNRMVHRIRTHQESFDEDRGRQVQDFELDEVIPGTESTFMRGAGDSDTDTDSDDYYIEEDASGDEEEGKEEVDATDGAREVAPSASKLVKMSMPHMEETFGDDPADREVSRPLDDDDDDNQQGDSTRSSGAYGDSDDVETHRLMMKKEVHKRTTIGADGREETTIREDSQVQQENDPPEELRDSMQEIINQFMESDPKPAELPPSESLEDEV